VNAAPASTFRQRFELRQELGRGGMGEVHLAYDQFAQREVAVKFANLKLLDDPEHGARHQRLWLNETRLAGKLHHPYIVEVHEAGLSDDLAYLVMEYVTGGTLQTRVRPDRLLPVESVTEIIYKVCSALEYASTQGLLHRDIKPANILLTSEQEPKVTDFGACYWLASDVTQVADVGTLPFIPPEHFKQATPTVQSDIYAVGVMMYQLLTGTYPYEASSQESLIYQKLQGLFTPIEQRRTGLAAELRFTVHRAIHKNREVRYTNWRAFRADLEHVLPGLTETQALVSDGTRFAELKGMPFFSGFGDTELWAAVRFGQWLRYAPGAPVCRAHNPGRSVFVIVQGGVQVTRDGRVLNRLGPGECFGELAYLDEMHGVRTATVTADAPSVAVEFEAAALRAAPASLQAAFARAFMRVMVGRLKQADERYLGQTKENHTPPP